MTRTTDKRNFNISKNDFVNGTIVSDQPLHVLHLLSEQCQHQLEEPNMFICIQRRLILNSGEIQTDGTITQMVSCRKTREDCHILVSSCILPIRQHADLVYRHTPNRSFDRFRQLVQAYLSKIYSYLNHLNILRK